jgi:hypothetical protein
MSSLEMYYCNQREKGVSDFFFFFFFVSNDYISKSIKECNPSILEVYKRNT